MPAFHNTPHRSLPGLIALILALGLSWSAVAQTQPEPATTATEPAAQETTPEVLAETPGDNRQGTFKTVEGEVTLVHGNSRSAVVVGQPVFQGDQIITGEKSATSITLRDGSVLSLGPNSSIELTQFEFDAKTQDGNMLVSLARGSLRVITGLIAKLRPEQVKITTPTTVIGVRGTDFIVEQNP